MYLNKIGRRHIIKKSIKHYLNIIILDLIDELKVELSKKQKLIWTKNGFFEENLVEIQLDC